MAHYEHAIDVAAPLTTAYNQWTQFEEFPKFMEGVKSVRQVTDTRLHWVAEIAGQERQWDAEITEQKPDSRIAWHSTSGAKNSGVVTFHYIDNDLTRVTLHIEYDPEGFIENVGAALGVVQRRIEGDLERFKAFIEAKPQATGAWRGEVERFPDQSEPWGHRYSGSTAPENEGSTAMSANDANKPPYGTPTRPLTDSDSGTDSAPLDADYGLAEERGQRNVLGDNTYISSGEGNGHNNGGGGIPTTGTGTAFKADNAAPGRDPRLINGDINHGATPGEEPAHSYGAVEDDPQAKNKQWSEENKPTTKI